MIPQAAIKKFLQTPRDDHRWVKDLKTNEIDALLQEFDPPPQLPAEMRISQKACVALGIAYPQFAFYMDMGVGKTWLALELLRYWFSVGKIQRALIFITSDKAFPTWEKQIHRYGIKIPYVLLEGSSERKWQILEEFGDGLVLINYAGAVSLVSESVRRPDGKVKWVLNDDLVAKLGDRVGAFVADESTRAAGHSSLTHKLLVRLGNTAQIRYLLAGRPMGRDPTLLWAQHYLLDRGETLGPTLGLFREAFFTSHPNRWVPKWQQKYIKEYTFNAAMMPQLSQMVQHSSISYTAAESIGTIPFVSIVEEVCFPQEAGEYYRKAVRSIIESKNNVSIVKNIFLRMRQLSSGFLGFKDDETGERAQVEFAENPKLERLLDLLQEIPDDCKAVIFYDFTHSGRQISIAAEGLGFEPIWLWSGTKDYKSELNRFEKDDKCRVAVVQNRVGAFSLDGLQVASYCFFYESPVSSIDREQAERRLRRPGQKQKVFQYDVIVKNSMDQRILDYHEQGEALIKALMRDPKRMLG